MNFFETLLNPDQDENPDRAEVANAANLLQIGEFQLLQLAFASWFGRDMTNSEGHKIFDSFMVASIVPPWARHYARAIVEADEAGTLDYNDPAYHRYDREYFRTEMSSGVRRFVVAVTIVVGVLGGSLAIASYTVGCTSSLPPCFVAEELESTNDKTDAAPDER